MGMFDFYVLTEILNDDERHDRKSKKDLDGETILGLLLSTFAVIAIIYYVVVRLPRVLAEKGVNAVLDNFKWWQMLLILFAGAGAIQLIRTINQAYLKKLNAEIAQLQKETKKAD